MEMGKSVVSGDESLIIRQYDAQRDEARVLALWQAAFNNEMASSMWRWKYIDNPYDTAILICENSSGEAVVYYGGTPFASTYCGRKIRMIHLSDIMSHPDYRGTGLFIHTANAYFDTFGTQDDLCIMYGFPGKYHFDVGVKYLQYSSLGKGAAFLTAQVKQITKQKNLPKDTITRINGPDPCFDNIWSQLKDLFPLSVIRDSAYMQWRFFQHPFKKYEVWCGKGDVQGGYSGYMVLQVDGKKAVIVDMLLSNDREQVKGFLVEVAEMLRNRGVETMDTWLPWDHFLVSIFKESAFKQKKEPIGIIPTIRLFDDTMEMEGVCSSFFYTMGDGDLY